jgi:mRNA-degrading endonuclease RelE of RelBE toxin-antitoxin system
LSPADAIRRLVKALANLPIDYDLRYVRDDLSNLRSVFPMDDENFASAVDATTHMLDLLMSQPTIGKELDHKLVGWRRVKYPSRSGGFANLRIIYRVDKKTNRVELRAFGHRNNPVSIYSMATRTER